MSHPIISRLVPVFLLALATLSGCGLIGPAVSIGLIKLHFGCLPEGSVIDTPTGPRAIETLATGDQVVGYSGEPVVVLQVCQYLEDPKTSAYLAVHFDGGDIIPLSPRHRIAGTPAAELQPGMEIGGRTVSEVSPVTGVARSFDLLTSDEGYRIHGIPVNSMIEEMLESARSGTKLGRKRLE